MKEVVRSLRSILSEQRRAVSEWVDVLPAVQWALNTAFRPRYGVRRRLFQSFLSVLTPSNLERTRVNVGSY